MMADAEAPMADQNAQNEVLVIPCSGIGKVHGLMSREAVYHVIDKLLPDQAGTVCLALLVTGDPETRRKVQETPCLTLDGCPKLCAYTLGYAYPCEPRPRDSPALDPEGAGA